MTINNAIDALSGDVTCVVIKGDKMLSSLERGIAPLIRFLADDADALRDALIADKIIGRAAAYIAIHGGAAEVYGEVMTDEAMNLLTGSGVKASRKTGCQHIINRRGDGICPMEAATASVSCPAEAYEIYALTTITA